MRNTGSEPLVDKGWYPPPRREGPGGRWSTGLVSERRACQAATGLTCGQSPLNLTANLVGALRAVPWWCPALKQLPHTGPPDLVVVFRAKPQRMSGKCGPGTRSARDWSRTIVNPLRCEKR